MKRSFPIPPKLKPKRRTYNVRRLKRLHQYTTDELARLFDVHKNTLRQWIKDGLRKIDEHKPHLFRGADVIAFLQNRQASRKRPCAPHEMYCLTCQAPRTPWGWIVEVVRLTLTRVQVKALCSVCEGAMSRITTPQKAKTIQTLMERHQREEVSLKDCIHSRSNCDIKGASNND